MTGATTNGRGSEAPELPPFDRRFLDGDTPFAVIGEGEIGGKARGLACAARLLAERFPGGRFGDLRVEIPRFAVIGTAEFERFVAQPAVTEAIRRAAPWPRG